MNAKELLKEIKTNNIDYAIQNEKGEIFVNRDTENIMGVFGLTLDDGSHIYGVYGDIVDGQIDNRNYSDEEIEQAIEFVLEIGDLVLRNEIDFKKFRSCTFWKEFSRREEYKEYEEWISTHSIVGSVVNHPHFGKGTIIEATGLYDIDSASITMEYEKAGRRYSALWYYIKKGWIE